ncbi:hypothetical protein GCK72_008606 [Caenorhabditis remanei]|uniref:Uncharacterized protein n=1 Tax=Caenorhabditis remanei TaxID=31234 RepID=A0A6A5GZ54_CAERE|nr:hypothetical protein GCK72_008606 [Caenorhabditis remanei]KAF1760357.1 hypothetical protein GCK72_008606 [Caenorhabditis remanei]
MKAILTDTLVLFGVRVGYTDFIKHCLNEEEFDKHWADHPLPKIASLNSARADIASSHEIANMHELCDLKADCDKATFIVLYGWRGTLSVSDFQRGPPGSKCTHGKTEEGLCIAPPKTESKTTTSPKSKVETTAPPTSKIETIAPPKSKIETTAPSRSDSEAIAPPSENNDEGVNSILVYLSIAFVSLFL